MVIEELYLDMNIYIGVKFPSFDGCSDLTYGTSDLSFERRKSKIFLSLNKINIFFHMFFAKLRKKVSSDVKRLRLPHPLPVTNSNVRRNPAD
jgi:hypothetical protein